ncbi:MAG TPA: BON domain-containing protein [Steroidobacteraceae bacterium]|nr:BON domain-containing protein [Steroidobacteraceae bacterium]
MASHPNRLSRAILAMTLLGSVLACTHAPPRTQAQKEADQEIETRVDNALQADTLLYAKHISVHAYNGVVRLSGFVWEPPDLMEAQRIAADVKGVTGVVNDLELQRNGLGDSPVSR